MGEDPKKLENSMPNFARVKKGEEGRLGGGRYNRNIAFERHEKTTAAGGFKDKKGERKKTKKSRY